MNICKIRRLRTFLHCKCTLAMQQRPSRLLKDLMLICSHVALLHFVLVSSIFCQKYKFLGETCQLRPLCPEGMQLVVSSHGGRLSCAPLTSPVPLTVTGTVEHLSQMSVTSVSQIRDGRQQQHFLLLEKGKDWIVPYGYPDWLGLWEQVLDIMLGMCCQLQVQTSPKKQSEKLLNRRSGLLSGA